MSVQHVGSEAFESDVLQAGVPTLVDFYADWCGPCRAMSSVLDEVADELGESGHVVKVNIDENPELAARYGVRSIPTFLVVRGGEVQDQLIGVQSKETLQAALAG
ncbi:MAG: thioredoxin [Planctomycetota bacterium]